MARFPTSASQWLELRKFRSLSSKYSFDFSSYKMLYVFPWCSCRPHIYVHDMVKQQSPREAESRQLLSTAIATGGSIWKCVTSSNPWAQSYKWLGWAYLFQAALGLEVVFSLPNAMSVCEILSPLVRKGFPTCTDVGACRNVRELQLSHVQGLLQQQIGTERASAGKK